VQYSLIQRIFFKETYKRKKSYGNSVEIYNTDFWWFSSFEILNV